MILATIQENSENIDLSVENGDAPIVLEVNESRDAYQLAVANGYSGSQSDWLSLTTGALNSSLLSGKGYLITASASGSVIGLAPNQSGQALIYDPSQAGGLRWGDVQGGVGGSGITSFNNRDGAVVSISGDYSDSLITNTSTIVGGTVKNALDLVDLRLGSTGSILNSLVNQTSGELNFYSTGRDAVLTNNLQSTGSNLYNLLINESGSFSSRLKGSGEFLINLNAATSGEINFYLTGSNASLSTRIDNSGSLFINGSGQLNHNITGLSFRLEQTGSATVNTVNSVFGRQGIIVQQSGDYSNTGITNQSNVAGATTADALNTLDQRLTSSGSLGGGGLVSSVFGRVGAVISQSGDYADTGITNTSSVDGNSVFHALNSIHSRLNNSGALLINLSGEFNNKLQATGSTLLNFANTISGELNFYLTGADSALSTRIDNSGSLFINGSGNLSNRIVSTGSTLNTFINAISGELNFYSTGADNALSSRIASTGSLLPNVTLNPNLTGIFSISGQEIKANDLGVDKLWFWDDSDGIVKPLSVGSGLTITDTTITASGGAGGSGWTLISEGSVSSAATLIEDGIFTDDYTEYQIVLIGCKIDTDTANVRIKLRASSADLTDNYALAGISVNTGGGSPSAVAYGTGAGQSFWPIYGADGTGTGEYAHTVIRLWPRLGLEQRMIFESNNRNYAETMSYYAGAGWVPGVTSNVDGFKITTSAEGSFTFDILKWRVFGR